MDLGITGVSAVNSKGEVIVFVDADLPVFDEFVLEGRAITLISASAVHKCIYGNAAADVARRSGVIAVQRLDKTGRDAGNYVIGVRHGR
jgi:hypothetical protein